MIARGEDLRSLRDRTESTNQSLRELAGAKASRSASTLFPRVEERYRALRKIAALDPRMARSLVLEPSVSAFWKQADSRLAPLLESPEEYEGPVEVVVADPEDSSREPLWIYRYYSEARAVEASLPANEAVGTTCGSIIRLEGLRLGDRLIVTRAAESVQAQEGPRCTPLGVQRVAVLMVRFPGVPAPPVSRAQVAEAFFGRSGRTVHTFYAEGSFDQVSIQGDVFGWYELDRSYSCDESTGLRLAAIRAADAEVDFREYDRVYILFTRPASGCPWLGLGSVGCLNTSSPGDGPIRVSFAWQPVANDISNVLMVATHELGHNFGLGHARTLRYPGMAAGPDRLHAISAEYGDRFSTMGNQAVSHHTMAHKVRMGWHDPRTAVVEVTGDGVFDIMPMQAEGDRPRALRIRRNIGSGQWLWIEYRQPIGLFDSLWPVNVRSAYQGALIRLEDAATGIASDLIDFNPPPVNQFATAPGNFLDPTLKPGRRWEDPYSDLELEVVEANPERLRVAVHYRPSCVSVTDTVPSLERGLFLLPGELDRIFLNVEGSAGCRYPVHSNSYWIQPVQSGWLQASATVEAALAENVETSARHGSITIGRQTILARQQGRPEPPALTFVSPSRGEIPRLAPSTWQIGFRDPNGAADIAAVHLLVHTGLDLAHSCHLRVDFASNRFGLANTQGDFVDVAIAANRMVSNRYCEVTYQSRAAISPVESRLQVAIRFLAPETDAYSVFAKVVDITGRTTDWHSAGTVSFTDACSYLPVPARIVANTTGATFNVVVQTGPTCEWSVSSSDEWISVGVARGAGQRMIPIQIQANPAAEDRRGVLRIAQVEIPVEQFGSQNTDVASLSLTPRETFIGPEGGEVRVTVSATPSTFRWAPEPGVSWMTVVANRNGVVSARVEPNETGLPRYGWILVGGQVFGVTQLANAPGR
ncbi:MAG: hypothetical protein NZV14_03530 [Bryobacteraceae bacterium]|nr:hypothetical protein [Bryobacteraceae bacterium]MDW8377208.1 BACON domain-containing carbohydrate-binding protein [Bryobacterales bacterium]